MDDQGGIPSEEFQTIAKILATVYLRYLARRRHEDSLDVPGALSVHGHEVNGNEKGEPVGNRRPTAA